ncbi:sigma-54 dependent transcriptional regulator [bacterium]|nr:sigma-54 dependent transcriptional regulator [bacterium]
MNATDSGGGLQHSSPKPIRVLLVDDDKGFAADLASLLADDYSVAVASSGEEALERVGGIMPDVVLLDVDMGAGLGGLAVLERLVGRDEPVSVIMVTQAGDIATVVQAIKLGAFHYVRKPPALGELSNLINLAYADATSRRRLRAFAEDVKHLSGEMVVADPAMLRILRNIGNVGPTDTTVLITGETGTGKEMVARRVHEISNRRDGPFVAVNCAAIPENLIESELFGHLKGAFTGAEKDRIGKFGMARGGTLFLDEIGFATMPLQSKLLRILEDGEYYPVGASAAQVADIRLIAASSSDPESRVASGDFLEELYHRLNVYRIPLPPLRERMEDVPALAEHFLGVFAQRCGKPIKGFSEEAGAFLLGQKWKGNVRGLRNAVERAVIDCDGGWIRPEHLAPAMRTWPAKLAPYKVAKAKETHRFKHAYMTELMQRCGGNVTAAAEAAGVPRPSLQRMLKEVGLSLDERE